MLDKLNSIKEKVFNSFKWKNSSSNIFWVVNKIDEKYLPLMGIANWKKPFYEVRKEIKDLVNDPAKNKEFLLMLWDTSSWKSLYESLIDISYNKLEEKLKWLNSKEKVEAKNLLKEVKSNALSIFSSVFSEISDDENIEISSFKMKSLLLILRGDSICFITNNEWAPSYIQFDKDYLNKHNSEKITNYEKSWEKSEHFLVARRHVDRWADLDKMEDSLRKYALFNKYFKQTKGNYVVTESWLNDPKFMKYYSKFLEDNWDDPSKKKIIKNFELTRSLSIWAIEPMPLMKDWEKYFNRRQKFIKNPKKWEKVSSLQKAILQYEEIKNQLQEWEAIMDLNKLK